MKKGTSTYMTAGEQIAGTAFFAIYLLVLPLVTDPFFNLCEKLLSANISPALRNSIYYYLLFVITIVIFHDFLAKTTHRLTDNLGECLKTIPIGLIFLYGVNELVYRITHIVMGNRLNLNDTTISAQISDAPKATFLIIIFIAPFIEEVLFRGLVFGCLKGKSRWTAYAVSCALFAFLHVWQFAVVQQNLTYLVLALQYFVPGLILAWAYEHTGSLWTSIGLHAIANALSLWITHA